MKRKPSSDVTTQTLLDFDLGESSSDSDFRIEDHDDESDDFSLGSKDDDDADDDSDEDNDEDDDDDDEDEIIDDAPTDVKHKHASVSDIVVTQGIVNSLNGDSLRIIGRIEPHSVAWHSHSGCGNDLEEEEQERGKSATDKAKNAAIEKLFMTLICCACLGDRSDDQNEIVECDGCGVTVHEGCYGVSECTSTGSTISSCSTEPWFCDACKAGVLNPDCELCPNKGGIFKETDVGKWVHLVCALYVPGVAFGEVDQLSSVTLFEMPYNKWGAKTCSLCEDAKLARTGVCIGCDAGMCKTYFHVTCAQYVGLLSEAHSEEADQADPFYAHCKIHSDKSLIKHRKRNYNTIKMRAAHRQLEEAQREANKTKPSSEQIRIERKLTKHRKRYLINKEIRNPPWVPTQKMPRLLITSATACKKMLFKAQLLGLDMTAIELQEAQMASLGDVRKKWHIPAAFSVEFIGYYLDRAIRLVDMKRNLEEQLVPTNNLLLAKQRKLRECYDDSVAKNQDAVKTNESCKASITQIYNYIYALCPNKALTPVDQIGKPIPTTMVVAATSYTKPHRDSTHQSCGVLANTVSQGAATPPARRTMAVPTAAALKMGVGFPLQNLMVPGNQQDDTGRILSTQCKQAGGGEELLNECGICKRCHDQHLLAKCDTCHLHYHLGCLNPPLTRHPKKSKLYGWQCSECDKSDDSNPESIIIPKAPRKSRTRYSKDGTIVPYDLSFTLVDQAHQLPSDSMCKKNISNTCLVDRKSLENAPLSITDLELPSCSEGLPVRALIKEEPTRSVEGSSKEFACQAMSNKQPRKRGRKKKSQFTSSSTPIIDQSKQLAYDGIKAERLDVSLKNQKEFSIDLNDQRDNVKSINQENSQDLLLVKDKVGGQDKSHQRCESIPTESTSTERKCVSVQMLCLENVQEANTTAPKDETAITTHNHKHSKRRKEKHRNRSPNNERTISKDHKRKRKRKNHDYELLDNADDRTAQAKYGDSRPRIKIKIKSVHDGSNTHTTQIFYVRDDPPSEEAITALPQVLSAVDSSCKLQKSMDNKDQKIELNMAPSVQSVVVDEFSPGVRYSGKRKREMNGSRLNAFGGTAVPVTSSANEESVCDVCHGSGTSLNIVQCDECHLNYHFGCLEPPLKKTPKRRGYSWHCADCDPTDVEN